MKITVNGQCRELNNPTNLKDIVHMFCKDSSRVISEINGEIVKASQWDRTTVEDGDIIELVSFVGGG
ncbi:MAG: sulfur carrier protein ThiS [Candidatus Omnitrophota bacterium]|nr:sulfur carrier protein ThiS [Candidatus Omnitrophota bacterium]